MLWTPLDPPVPWTDTVPPPPDVIVPSVSTNTPVLYWLGAEKPVPAPPVPWTVTVPLPPEVIIAKLLTYTPLPIVAPPVPPPWPVMETLPPPDVTCVPAPVMMTPLSLF